MTLGLEKKTRMLCFEGVLGSQKTKKHVLGLFSDTTNGATDDWSKNIGVKYSYNPELRGDWFSIDESEISKSVSEFTSGVIAMMTAIEKREEI